MIDLNQLIFTDLPFNGTRLFLCLFNLALALRFLFQFNDQLYFFETQLKDTPTKPILHVLPVPKLNRRQFSTVGVVFVVALILCCFGFITKLFLLILIVCYFLYFSQIIQLAYVVRKTNPFPLIFLILLFAPGLDTPFSQPTSQWPLFLVKICIACVYFFSAIAKIRSTGLSWGNGENLQSNLLEHYLWGEEKWALLVAQNPFFCTILGNVTFVFELTFPLILIFPKLIPIYAALGLAFHYGIGLTMRIYYTKYFCLCYLVFVIDLLVNFNVLVS